jgi:hypothetical protein
MKPTQKELNEFVLDLVEFMGKHFTDRFDKTRVAGGNEGTSIRLRRTQCGSELEIATDRLDPYFEYGLVRWDYRGLIGSKDALFERIQGDLTAVLLDRLFTISGFRGEMFLGGMVFRDLPEAEALQAFRKVHPDCQKAMLKKWTRPKLAYLGVAGFGET